MNKVNILEVMDKATDAVNPRISPEHAKWNSDLREARAIVADMLEAMNDLIARCDDELADPEDVAELEWAKRIVRLSRGEEWHG